MIHNSNEMTLCLSLTWLEGIDIQDASNYVEGAVDKNSKGRGHHDPVIITFRIIWERKGIKIALFWLAS